MRLSDEEKRKIYITTLIVILSLVFYFFMLNISSLWSAVGKLFKMALPIVLGFCLAFILNILLNGIEYLLTDKLKMKKGKGIRLVSIILSYLIFGLLIVFVAISVIPQFVDSIVSLTKQMPNILEDVIIFMKKDQNLYKQALKLEDYIASLNAEKIGKILMDFFSGKAGYAFSGTINALQMFVAGFFNTFLIIVFSVYALSNKENLSKHSKRFTYALFPEKVSDRIVYIARMLYKNFYNFFTGQFIEAILLGILAFIGMTILRLPYALMISVMLGFMNIIPYFGSIFGSIIGAVIIFMSSPVQALIFLVFAVVLQQFDGNVMYPRLVGKQIGVPSMWIIMSITLGGAMLGVVGMIIFVPLLSTVYMLLKEFTEKRLENKEIEIEKK